MKNKIFGLLTLTAAYSYLFYEQNAGINFLIFNVLVIFFTGLIKPELVKNKKWYWALSLCLISATGILLNSSTLSIFANLLSLLIFSAVSFNPNTSSLTSLFFGWLSVFLSPVFLILDLKEKTMQNSKQKRLRNAATILIVFVFATVFFLLYENANPLFAENMKWLNLDFISFDWLVFTLIGLLISFGLLYQQVIPSIEAWDNELSLNNDAAADDTSDRFKIERQAGTAIFILLNLMLVVLNIGDIHSLWLGGHLPKGVSHSDFVHRGVGNLIISIIMAVGLVMFLFRKNYKGLLLNSALRFLVMLWIFQTLIMLYSASQRNQIYVDAYNLTYRRIGVFAWLAIAGLGLLVLFLKITKERSNWYLVRKNVSLWFSLLALTSLVNWDATIARYNLNNKLAVEVDIYYLFYLSDAVIPELEAFSQTAAFHGTEARLKKRLPHFNFQHELSLKKEHYLKDYTNNWQSWDLRDQKITNSILK